MKKRQKGIYSVCRRSYLNSNMEKHGIFGDRQEAYEEDRGNVTLLRCVVRFWKA